MPDAEEANDRLSPEGREKIRQAQLRRWHPEEVKEAVEKGEAIPAAPASRSTDPDSAATRGTLHGKGGESGPMPSSNEASGATPTASKGPVDIPIMNETAPPKGGPAPASWYSEGPVILPETVEKGPKSEDFDLGSDMLVSTVSMAHGWAADESGYEGWRLTAEEVELWRKVIKFLLRYLPLKDWPIIATLIALTIMEGKKFVGWSRFRKAKKGPTRPQKAPPTENEPPVERTAPREPAPEPATGGAYAAPKRKG